MNTPMGKAMSKRVLGVGILAFGGLILAIGLIIGLEFPKYVYRRALQDVCILDANHEEFSTWVKDANRNKTNRLYFWELVNADEFLYHGALPSVIQRGPYVYQEESKKLDVKFRVKNHHITFRHYTTQTFDEALTREECGLRCSEHDEMTILNREYFRVVNEMGGATNYALSKMSDVLRHDIEHITLFHQHPNTTAHTMNLLGVFSSDVDDQLEELLQFSQYSLASWLYGCTTENAVRVMASRGERNFTSREMYGLYGALTNPLLCGAHKCALTDTAFQEECDTLKTLPNILNVTYQSVHYYCDSAYSMLPLSSPSSSSSSTSSSSSSSSSSHPVTCGLIFYLRRFEYLKTHGTESDLRTISNIIHQYLCTDVEMSCFLLPDDFNTRTAYIDAIADYIFNHLVKYVFSKVVLLRGEDLIHVRSPKELALGYYRSEYVNSTFNETKYVPGILTHDEMSPRTAEPGIQMAVFNCYNALGALTNFMWKSYDGKSHATIDQFPSTTEDERSIFSQWLNMPPYKDLNACDPSDLLQQSYGFFLLPFWRRMSFSKSSHQRLYGVKLRRLAFDQNNLLPNNSFIDEAGLQEMTGTFGYLSWTSLPSYLLANNSVYEAYNMVPSTEENTPYIDVEPVTGEAWRGRLLHQHSVGIQASDVMVPRDRALLIGLLNYPIPVYWLDHSYVFNEHGLSKYKSRVQSLMKTSCGGLIGLSAVAAVVMLIGLLAATITVRGGRVAPIENEEMSMY